MKKTEDPRVLGKGDQFDTMPYFKKGSFHLVPESILLLLE